MDRYRGYGGGSRRWGARAPRGAARLGFALGWLVALASPCAWADGARDELLAADRAFSLDSSMHGRAAAFAEYAARDALMFRPGGAPIEGLEAIKASMAAEGTGTLTWSPHSAVVAASGELGYTWGDYRFVTGEPCKAYTGHYVSIWRHEDDGHWKWVVDIGNPGAEPGDCMPSERGAPR